MCVCVCVLDHFCQNAASEQRKRHATQSSVAEIGLKVRQSKTSRVLDTAGLCRWGTRKNVLLKKYTHQIASLQACFISNGISNKLIQYSMSAILRCTVIFICVVYFIAGYETPKHYKPATKPAIKLQAWFLQAWGCYYIIILCQHTYSTVHPESRTN